MCSATAIRHSSSSSFKSTKNGTNSSRVRSGPKAAAIVDSRLMEFRRRRTSSDCCCWQRKREEKQNRSAILLFSSSSRFRRVVDVSLSPLSAKGWTKRTTRKDDREDDFEDEKRDDDDDDDDDYAFAYFEFIDERRDGDDVVWCRLF